MIRIKYKEVDPDLLEKMCSELSPRNPERERAAKERVSGLEDVPETIDLWRREGDDLVLPRGYAHRLERLASSLGVEVEWESGMTILPYSERLHRDWPPFALRDYQVPARDALLDWAQGLLSSPTGSGKSAISLEFVRWAGQRSLIVVGKTSLARQWQEMALRAYGVELGYVGEGEWREADVTVALWQTLWSRREKIEPDWWASWGALVIDEVQHASSSSLSALAERFPAFYRVGVSATPRWTDDLFPIVEAVVGPVVHTVTHEDVGDRLVRPSVRTLESSFRADYQPTRHIRGRRVSNNFSEVMSALVEDPERNDLIARVCLEEAREGHHVLLVTRRIEHVRQITRRLEHELHPGKRLHALTGAQIGADAERVKRAVERANDAGEGTVIVSTTAEEGFDLVLLDRLVMAFPLRRTPLVEQQVGRVVRPAPGKKDAVVYDVVDPLVPVLKAQAVERRKLYGRRRWPVYGEE